MNAGTSPSTAALAYLARGWSVVAIVPGAKRPTVGWQPYQQAPASEDEVKGWFRHQPEAGVAIVTGAVSALLVLDVDPRHGGEESLRRLQRVHGTLPPTPEVLTGGGGRHLYFAHPGGMVRNRVGLMPGVDVRGDGGLVVAPPSLHPSGRRYVWVRGRGPADIAPASLPDWLLSETREGRGQHGHALNHWRELVGEGVGEGERNSSVASLAGHLLWHGVDPAVVMELLLCWNRERCQPPLDDEEVARVVRSITRLHEGPGCGPS
jgi:hypothetical protein